MLDTDVVVEVDDVVVLVEVVQLDAEETDVGDVGGSRVEPDVEEMDMADNGGSWTVGAADGCWVPWPMMTTLQVRASGVWTRFPWCLVCAPVQVLWMVSCMVRGGVVELSRLRGQVGDLGGGSLQLQDMWVCLLEAFEGAKEAGHVVVREVGIALGGGVWARPQQGHEAGCHHVQAELYGDGAAGGGSRAVQGGVPLLGTDCYAWICQDRWVYFGGAVHPPTKALVAAADEEQRVQGPALPRAQMWG